MSEPAYWQEAQDFLAQADPVLAGLIAIYPGAALAQKGDPFATLARAIVSQQISVKAAEAIWVRCLALLGEMAPAPLLASEEDALRIAGLSRPKIRYLRDLAARAQDGRFEPARWQAMDDAAVMAELMAVKGIGRWTAEMYLIFSLQRPDVFPLDDIGLQKAVAVHYLGGERPTPTRLADLGERWRPWRSVATWYLWRSLDPVAVEY